MDWQNTIREFITLLTVIDPIGSIPVFLYAVTKVPPHLHRSYAARGVTIAGIVLLAFMIGGQAALEALGLHFGSFKIAGGIILFLFALTMIFGHSKPEKEISEAESDPLAGAVFPLAMPSIASPGAMLAVVVLTDNNTQSVSDQFITAGLLLIILFITLGLLLAASFIYRFIGQTGTSIISRVMGIILATIAIDAILSGLNALGILSISAL